MCYTMQIQQEDYKFRLVNNVKSYAVQRKLYKPVIWIEYCQMLYCDRNMPMI